jgi:TonB family protein
VPAVGPTILSPCEGMWKYLTAKHHHWRCTRCGCPFLQRSRTRIWERPLRLLLLRPYRCRECGHRCYASTRHQGTTGQEQTHSVAERQVFAGDGAVRIGTGKKWMLVYGLLAGLCVVAIAGLRPNLSVGGLQWPFASKHQAHDESLPRESAELKAPSRAADAQPSGHPSPLREARRPTGGPQLAEQPSRLSHTENDSGSIPAEAIRAERPKVSEDVQSTITSDNTVKVRVRINESGRVIDATVVSATGPVATSLQGYSLETARRWRFRPARNNGQVVQSDRILEFLFRPSDC